LANVKREHDRTGTLVSRLLALQEPAWHASESDAEQRTSLVRDHVLSVAIWRRFGSLDFVDRLGFVRCPSSEEEFQELLSRVMSTALGLWRQGIHSCTDAYGPAKHCHAVELFAWIDVDSEQDLAKQKVSLRDAERRGEPLRHLTRLRRSVATEHGERMVQAALETFLNKEAQPLRALWQQCAGVAEALSS
ncbi:unnamed protein product, partial [Polarella glacialis]